MSDVDWNEAPEWASRAVKFSGENDVYWAGCGNCQKIDGAIVYVMNKDDYEILSIRPDDKWQEGEERMNNIGPNGNDGEHYADDKGDINISETDRLQGDDYEHLVLNDPIISAIIGKQAATDVIEHDNNNKYSSKIKTIVVDGIDHDIYVDVYDVLTAFNVINPATAHAVKKELMPGKRGAKGVIQDLTEARDSLNRAIEIEKNK